MKIVISEYSFGFADSTCPLCNAMADGNDEDQIIYLCEKGNPYIAKLQSSIEPNEIFRSFKTGDNYKKGGIRWLIDRCSTSLWNARERDRFIGRERPDIVLVMLTLSSVDQFFLPALKRCSKVFLTVHDVIVPQRSLSWNYRALKRIYDLADGLIVHSERNREQLLEEFHVGAGKIHVIHHGLEPCYDSVPQKECKEQIGLETSDPVLLFYGGIRESKGLDILIKALKGLRCHLLIAGSMPYGESFDRYDRMLEEYEISCTKYIEFTPDEFRDVLFQAADFIVLPYKRFYSQSGVFMQAIHYRKPVIATDVSSFRDYVERYDMGYICEPDDVDALHGVIETACYDKSAGRWHDTAGIERAARENSWEASARLYLETFKQELKIANGQDT